MQLRTRTGLIGIVIAAVAAAVGMIASVSSWVGWQGATCAPDHCFCEEIRPEGVAQPSNAWSSLGFVLVGLVVLSLPRRWNGWERRARPQGQGAGTTRLEGPYAATYGLALVVLGTGSMFYHASLTFLGQTVDLAGMYLLVSFLILYRLAGRGVIGPWRFVGLYAGVNLALLALVVELPGLRRYVFVAMLGVALIIDRGALWAWEGNSGNRPLLRGALVTLVIGAAAWVLDERRILCSPPSALQGHALWHLLGATAAALAYFDSRSEGTPADEPEEGRP